MDRFAHQAIPVGIFNHLLFIDIDAFREKTHILRTYPCCGIIPSISLLSSLGVRPGTGSHMAFPYPRGIRKGYTIVRLRPLVSLHNRNVAAVRVQRLREAARPSLAHNIAFWPTLLAFLSSQIENPRSILTIH